MNEPTGILVSSSWTAIGIYVIVALSAIYFASRQCMLIIKRNDANKISTMSIYAFIIDFLIHVYAIVSAALLVIWVQDGNSDISSNECQTRIQIVTLVNEIFNVIIDCFLLQGAIDRFHHEDSKKIRSKLLSYIFIFVRASLGIVATFSLGDFTNFINSDCWGGPGAILLIFNNSVDVTVAFVCGFAYFYRTVDRESRTILQIFREDNLFSASIVFLTFSLYHFGHYVGFAISVGFVNTKRELWVSFALGSAILIGFLLMTTSSDIEMFKNMGLNHVIEKETPSKPENQISVFDSSPNLNQKSNSNTRMRSIPPNESPISVIPKISLPSPRMSKGSQIPPRVSLNRYSFLTENWASGIIPQSKRSTMMTMTPKRSTMMTISAVEKNEENMLANDDNLQQKKQKDRDSWTIKGSALLMPTSPHDDSQRYSNIRPDSPTRASVKSRRPYTETEFVDHRDSLKGTCKASSGMRSPSFASFETRDLIQGKEINGKASSGIRSPSFTCFDSQDLLPAEETSRASSIIRSPPYMLAETRPMHEISRASSGIISPPHTPFENRPMNGTSRASSSIRSAPYTPFENLPMNGTCRASSGIRSAPYTPFENDPMNETSRASSGIRSLSYTCSDNQDSLTMQELSRTSSGMLSITSSPSFVSSYPYPCLPSPTQILLQESSMQSVVISMGETVLAPVMIDESEKHITPRKSTL